MGLAHLTNADYIRQLSHLTPTQIVLKAATEGRSLVHQDVYRTRSADRYNPTREAVPSKDPRASIVETLTEEDLELLETLPYKEVQIFRAYYFGGYTQTEIADHIGTTQANVSYMISKCSKRLHFLKNVRLINESEIREKLAPHFDSPDLEMLVQIRLTTCQSDAAKLLGWTQGKVRYRLFRAIKYLEELSKNDRSFLPYFFMFDEISNNFNILKEVGRKIQVDLRDLDTQKMV